MYVWAVMFLLFSPVSRIEKGVPISKYNIADDVRHAGGQSLSIGRDHEGVRGADAILIYEYMSQNSQTIASLTLQSLVHSDFLDGD